MNFLFDEKSIRKEKGTVKKKNWGEKQKEESRESD
jgi:hypothetical protein